MLGKEGKTGEVCGDSESRLGCGSENVQMDTASRQLDGIRCQALGKVLNEGLRYWCHKWIFQ